MSNSNGSLNKTELIQFLKSYASENGGKLATVREIAARFDVGHSKVQKAIKALEKRDIIEIGEADHRRPVRFKNV